MDRVLIIEADAHLAAVLRQKLETAGFDVAVANNGRAALALEQRGPASVVFADLAPAARGEIVIELCKRYPHTKLIAADFARQPFAPGEVVTAVEAVLSQRV